MHLCSTAMSSLSFSGLIERHRTPYSPSEKVKTVQRGASVSFVRQIHIGSSSALLLFYSDHERFLVVAFMS